MKSIKIILSATILSCCILGFTACSEDKPDKNNSTFNVDDESTWTEFDYWLDRNFRVPYNISVLYKYNDIESDMSYNLIPADPFKSMQACKLVKFLFIEIYDELAGVDFTRQFVPKVYQLVGSSAWQTATIVTNGTAEGGIKITLFGINSLDPLNPDAAVFNTLHHEFFHILHQTVLYPLEFENLSADNYVGSSWSNYNDAQAASLGFVSPYSRNNTHEDFAETMSRYVTRTDQQWEDHLALGTDEGRDIIAQKLAICKDYMLQTWNINLDDVKENFHIRKDLLPYVDFDNM